MLRVALIVFFIVFFRTRAKSIFPLFEVGSECVVILLIILRSEFQFFSHQLENVEVGLKPRAEEVGLLIVLPYGRDQRVPFQHPHVMLHQSVLQPQVMSELIQVPRAFSYGPYYLGPVLCAPGPA